MQAHVEPTLLQQETNMNDLIQSMLVAFGNNFTYYLRAHNFHWTVMGPNFPQYHSFLEDIYTDAQESIDAYAEQLRRIGAFPKGDFRDIVSNNELDASAADITDPEQMFTILDSDTDVIVRRLQDTFDLATKYREYGLQNFLADRIDQHRKQQWMIDSILGEQAIPEGTEPEGE